MLFTLYFPEDRLKGGLLTLIIDDFNIIIEMICLQFHRAIRLYQISHPTEKRSALKLLQNLRAVNQKVNLLCY